MKRTVLRVDGRDNMEDVGDDYKAWNKAIGADWGELVVSPDRSIELWCDEEGLCKGEPIVNVMASLLVKRPIVGDVIVFYPGDVK
jgi:hypothetical protein